MHKKVDESLPAVCQELTAVVIHTGGELWHAAAGFEISFALAPPRATGQYLGVFGPGAGLAEAFGPALLIWLSLGWGAPTGTSWASCPP